MSRTFRGLVTPPRFFLFVRTLKKFQASKFGERPRVRELNMDYGSLVAHAFNYLAWIWRRGDGWK